MQTWRLVQFSIFITATMRFNKVSKGWIIQAGSVEVNTQSKNKQKSESLTVQLLQLNQSLK